jgi:hypothetical protein
MLYLDDILYCPNLIVRFLDLNQLKNNVRLTLIFKMSC